MRYIFDFTLKAANLVISALLISVVMASLTYGASAPVGTLEGDLKISSDGAAMYSVPIVVPPGTNGVQPTLSLKYHSHQQNRQLGVGWSLTEISLISRCPQTQAQDGDDFIGSVGFDASNRFCVDGQRLMVTSGEYGESSSTYRTEIESWVEFTAHGSCGAGPCKFTATAKDGSQLVFGEGGGSRVLVPDSETVRVWALHKIVDRNGNTVKAFYLEDSENYESYLDRIEYTSNETTGSSAQRMVKFTYEARDDIYTDYINGVLTQKAKRLSNIRTYVDLAGNAVTNDGNSIIDESNLVHSYYMSYDYSPVTGRSRMIAIEMCDSEGVCLPATTFEWQDAKLNSLFEGAGNNISFNTYICENNSNGCTGDDNYKFIDYPDVNGDGFLDLAIRTDNGIVVWWGSADGYDENNRVISSICNNSECNDSDNFTSIRYPDLNSDGKADLVFRSDAEGVQVYHGSDAGFVFVQSTNFCYNNNSNCNDADNHSTIRYPDVNRDGFLDLVVRKDNGIEIWWGTADGFDKNNRVSSSICNNSECNDEDNHTSIRYLDVNADGKTDLVFRSDAEGVQVYHGSDEGFVFVQSTNFCYNKNSKCNDADNHSTIRYPDVNGDGFLDLVVRKDSGMEIRWGTANGFNENGRVFSSICDNSECNDEDNYNTITYPDLNGDGKADLAFRSDNGGLQFYLGSDAGFVFHRSTGICSKNDSTCKNNNNYTTIQYPDLNGDGFADLTIRKDDGIKIWWGNISGFRGTNAATSVICRNNNTQCNDADNYDTIKWLDVTGDRMLNLVFRTDERGINIKKIFDVYPDMITKITNGIGQETLIEYKPLTDTSVYTKGNSAEGKQIDIQFAQYVVSRHTIRADDVVEYSYSHHYHEAKWESQGKGYLGFAKTETTNDQTSNTTITNMYQVFPYIGLQASQEVTDSQGRSLIKMTTDYGHKKHDYGGYTVFKEKETTQYYDSNGLDSHSRTVAFDYDDSFGLITQIADYGDDSLDDDDVYACYDYYTSETLWKRFRPVATKVRAAPCQNTGFSDSAWDTNVDLSFKQYEYDSKMNLTKQRVYNDTENAWIESISEYDAYGNTITLADPEGNTVAINYDSLYQTFPIIKTALSSAGTTILSTENQYEPKFGLQIEAKDANGVITAVTNPTTDIDGFGRIVASQYMAPDGSGAVTVSRVEFLANPDGGTILKTLQRKNWVDNDAENWLWTKTYLDPLGRQYKSERKHDDGKVLTTHILYDEEGRLWKESAPYFQGEGDIRYTVYEYDILGNNIKTIGPDGAYQQFDYGEVLGKRDIAHYYLDPSDDSNQINSFAKTNTRGNVIQTVAVDGSEKSYRYDLLGRRVEIRDAIGQVSSSRYNSLGQIVSQSEPELGTSYYEYYKTGLIKSSTDAEGQKIIHHYDQLGRLLVKKDGDNNELARYEYDSGVNGKGKLGKVYVKGELTYAYNYDYLGGISNTIVYMDIDQDGNTEAYTNAFTYDAAGQPKTVTYPDGSQVKYEYLKDSGLLYDVLAKDAGNSSYQSVVTYSEFDALGNAKQHAFANGVKSAFEFDLMGRVASEYTYKGALDLVDKEYRWNRANKITANIHTNNPELDEYFSYYNTGSLSEASGPYGTINYQYDAAGNMIARDGIHYQYDANKKHQMISACSGAAPCSKDEEVMNFAYDANGNMSRKTVLTDDGQTMTWRYYYDVEHRLVSVEQQRLVDTNSTTDWLQVEAEAYASQSGTKLESTTDSGGGENVGYIEEGDLLSYNLSLPEEGLYTLELRVASKVSDAVIHIKNNLGEQVSINMPNTGGWQKWRTISADMLFSKGSNTLTFEFEAANYVGNINWFRLGIQAKAVTTVVNAFTYDDVGRRLSKTDADGTVSYYISHLMDVTVRSNEEYPIKTNYTYGNSGSAIRAKSSVMDSGANGFALINYNSNIAAANLIETDSLTGTMGYLMAKMVAFVVHPQFAAMVILLLVFISICFVTYYLASAVTKKSNKPNVITRLVVQIIDKVNPFNALPQPIPGSVKHTRVKAATVSKKQSWVRCTLPIVMFTFLTQSMLAKVTLALGIGFGAGYPVADQVRYFHQNAVESSVLVTDENGAQANNVVYEPFGSAVEAHSSGEDTFRAKFSGKEYDAYAELYYFGSRYYDADLGRFITPDPARQYDSPYIYSGNDPLAHIDPDGEFAFTIGTLVIFTLTATGAYSGGAAANGTWDPTGWDMGGWKTWAGIGGGALLGAAGGSAIAGGSIFSASLIMGSQSALFTGLGGGSATEIGTSFAIGFATGFAMGAAMGGTTRVAGYYFGPTAGPAIARSSLLLGLTGYDTYNMINDPSIENGIALGTDIVLLGSGARTNALSRAASRKAKVKVGGCNCGCNSFPAGTEIALENNDEVIENVKVGDRVWSYNEVTGEQELNAVSQLFNRIAPGFNWITIGQGDQIEDTIEVTPEHPFYTVGGEWVKAEDLSIGDRLLKLDGTTVTVLDLGYQDEAIEVFNFSVTEVDNYYASKSEVLVHNTKSCQRYSQRVAGKSQQKTIQKNLTPQHAKRTSKPPARYGSGDGILSPGPYANHSIPGAYNRNFTASQRAWLNGKPCHRCGNTPATVLDHQPPMAMGGPNATYKLYPHCASCSSAQGGQLARMKAKGQTPF